MIRRRAALVPLAALAAVALLSATPAWSQTPEPEPTDTVPSETLETDTGAPEPQAPEADPSVLEVDVERPTVEPEDDAANEKTSLDRRSRRARPAGGHLPVPTKVTLYVSDRVAKVGTRVRANGKLSPGGANKWVKLVDPESGTKIKTVRTDPEGKYRAEFVLQRNVPLQARWEDAVRSTWQRVVAVPRLSLRMDTPLVFARTLAEGKISRAAGGKWVQIRLRRINSGRFVAKKVIRTSDSGRFRTRFRIEKPGTYSTSVRFTHDDWREVTKTTARKSTPLPSLRTGSRGVFVKLLERRLAELGHHLKNRNSYFGQDTADAVMAFNKVNNRARVSYIGAASWYALASATRPKARFDGPRFHIEVDQSKQVLYVVRRGKVSKILHVATGAPSTPTYDGTYQFGRKLAGYSPNRLYYPSYFHGLRAIHGWPKVPPYKASHGCVRVPMWAARWIYAKIDIGDTIRIYH